MNTKEEPTIQWTGNNTKEVIAFATKNPGTDVELRMVRPNVFHRDKITVETPDGYETLFLGDSVVKREDGFYVSKASEEPLFDTCESVGSCPRPTTDSAPFHHFYWDDVRDDERMRAIHGERGRGHQDPLSEYGAVVCKTCEMRALVKQDAEDFPEI